MASARVFLMFALVAIVVMACQIEARTLRGIDIERTTATCAKWGKHKAAAGTKGDATVSNFWLPSFICATYRLYPCLYYITNPTIRLLQFRGRILLTAEGQV